MPKVLPSFCMFLILGILISNTVQADNNSALPTKEEVQRYADNLISNYNRFIKENGDLGNKSFLRYKQSFSLLREDGESFRVIVVRGYGESVLNLIFAKIKYYQNEVELEYEDSLASYTGIGVFIGAESSLTISGGGKIQSNYSFFTEPLVLGINSTTLKGDYFKNSYEMAQKLYSSSIDNIHYSIREDKIWLPFKGKYNKTIFDNKNFTKTAEYINTHRLSDEEFYGIFENFSKEVKQEDFNKKSSLEKISYLLNLFWNKIKIALIHIWAFIEKLSLIWKIIVWIVFFLSIVWSIYTAVLAILNKRKKSKKVTHIFTVIARKFDSIKERELNPEKKPRDDQK